MKRSLTLAEIAALVDGEVRGDAGRVIVGVAPLHAADEQHLTWITHPRYRSALAKSRAGAVLVDRGFGATPMPAVLCDNVDSAVAAVLGAFAAELPTPPPGLHPTAQVDPSATLGENVAVGPLAIVEAGARLGDGTILHAGVYVGPGSTIGSSCRLWNNVVVREGCRLGDRVIVHANAVIGADGFGYYFRDGRHHKIPHVGGVTIGNDVEIGAGACVDRSKTGATVIGDGTKIDNLVQVAHNVEIGANCLLCAQVGIAGSTRLGNCVVLGGQTGVRDNIALGDGVMVAACSSIAQDVPAGAKIAGTPAVEVRQFLRESTSLRKLPGLVAKFKELSRRVEALEAAANHKPDG